MTILTRSRPVKEIKVENFLSDLDDEIDFYEVDSVLDLSIYGVHFLLPYMQKKSTRTTHWGKFHPIYFQLLKINQLQPSNIL